MGTLKTTKTGTKKQTTTQEEFTRMNIMVEKEKHKAFFLKARMSGSDMTKVVNQWIDDYLSQ